MRNDIPNETLEKVNSKIQTRHEQSNPKLSLIISRKETMLEDETLIEKKRVARAAVGAMTDCGIAVCHPRHSVEDSSIWICYIKSGKLYVKCSKNAYDLSSSNWEQVNISDGEKSADKCDIAFETSKVENEFITGKRPLIFYLQGNAVKYLLYDTVTKKYKDYTLVDSGASAISAGRGANGSLVLYYISSGTVYFKTYKDNEWSNAYTISQTLSGVSQISAFDFDNVNTVGLTAYANGKTYQIFGLYSVLEDTYSWSSWTEVATSDSVGTVVQYHDSKIQAIYNHGTLCYKEYDSGYGEEEVLYDRQYYAIKSNNLNKGTLYMVLLIEKGDYSIVYLFRYVYMKDISTFTSNANYSLQVDNAITQTEVNVKNINDSLYTSDATLFAPTSKLVLGVSYGDSDIIPMTVAYIDEVQHTAGISGTSISISGRNVTGAYLHDLTFDDSFEIVGTPSEVVAQIMEYFGIEDYEVDTSADEDEQNVAQVHMIVAEPDKTPLKALQELASMISEDASLGKTWGNEELYDGKLIIGFDDFRNSFNPKSFYTLSADSRPFRHSHPTRFLTFQSLAPL